MTRLMEAKTGYYLLLRSHFIMLHKQLALYNYYHYFNDCFSTYLTKNMKDLEGHVKYIIYTFCSFKKWKSLVDKIQACNLHIFKKLHDTITIIFTQNFEQFFISFNSTQHFVLSLRKVDIILMSCKSINKNKSWRPIRQLEIVLRFLSPRKLNK